MMTSTPPITRDTLIEDIVHQYPRLVRPLREYGIVCIRCGEPIWGSLEQAADEKGIENIDDIVKALNDIINSDNSSFSGEET